MRKLKADLDRLKALLEEKNPGGAEALRFAEVNDLWKNAVAAVFGGDSAALVLDHTNSVYVMSGEQGGNLRRFDRPRSETQGPVEGKVLAVYCDDSMVRSELDNRQELLKMKFKEQGEDVEALRILPSTRDMKNRHPFREEHVWPPCTRAPTTWRTPRCAGPSTAPCWPAPPAATARRGGSDARVHNRPQRPSILRS